MTHQKINFRKPNSANIMHLFWYVINCALIYLVIHVYIFMYSCTTFNFSIPTCRSDLIYLFCFSFTSESSDTSPGLTLLIVNELQIAQAPIWKVFKLCSGWISQNMMTLTGKIILQLYMYMHHSRQEFPTLVFQYRISNFSSRIYVGQA